MILPFRFSALVCIYIDEFCCCFLAYVHGKQLCLPVLTNGTFYVYVQVFVPVLSKL